MSCSTSQSVIRSSLLVAICIYETIYETIKNKIVQICFFLFISISGDLNPGFLGGGGFGTCCGYSDATMY